MLMEVSSDPPKESMGTLIPEFPKGLTGILPSFSDAGARLLNAAIADPAPAMPAAFKNRLRDHLLLLSVIFRSL